MEKVPKKYTDREVAISKIRAFYDVQESDRDVKVNKIIKDFFELPVEAEEKRNFVFDLMKIDELSQPSQDFLADCMKKLNSEEGVSSKVSQVVDAPPSNSEATAGGNSSTQASREELEAAQKKEAIKAKIQDIQTTIHSVLSGVCTLESIEHRYAEFGQYLSSNRGFDFLGRIINGLGKEEEIHLARTCISAYVYESPEAPLNKAATWVMAQPLSKAPSFPRPNTLQDTFNQLAQRGESQNRFQPISPNGKGYSWRSWSRTCRPSSSCWASRARSLGPKP